mmetsp:Transcript_20816/g.31797  ORF Transcript_20816/g.31797 Transcript_20816/m.31797 type:complete len:82 (+) Transcript_20816:431-676(+)
MADHTVIQLMAALQKALSISIQSTPRYREWMNQCLLLGQEGGLPIICMEKQSMQKHNTATMPGKEVVHKEWVVDECRDGLC